MIVTDARDDADLLEPRPPTRNSVSATVKKWPNIAAARTQHAIIPIADIADPVRFDRGLLTGVCEGAMTDLRQFRDGVVTNLSANGKMGFANLH